MQNSANGQCVSEICGESVASRPTRSPMFQQRKASGMKIAGVMVLTEVMFAVKTGKTIVTAKQMNTAVARNGIRIKSVLRGMDSRALDDRLPLVEDLRSFGLVLAWLVATSPSEVPFAVVLEADSSASLVSAIFFCRRRR